MVIEVRYGLTGVAVDVNHVQVFWSKDVTKAELFARNLRLAINNVKK